MSDEKQIKWSISTIETLRRCGRQYFFGHVAAHHRAKNDIRKEAYALKKMKSLSMWKGSIVEKGIEKFIINKLIQQKEIDQADAISESMALARSQFDFSQKRLFMDSDLKVDDEYYCQLDIHAVNKEYEFKDVDLAFEEIEQSLTNFFDLILEDQGLSIYELFQNATWIKADLTNYYFLLDNIKVNPQIDVLLYYDNKPVIIDWKVSRNEASDYSKQMLICGITLKHVSEKRDAKKKLPYGDISIYEVNLLLGKVKRHVLNPDAVNEIVDYVYSTSGDIAISQAYESFENIDIRQYPLTDKEGTCQLCNYETLCNKVIKQKKNIEQNESAPELF